MSVKRYRLTLYILSFIMQLFNLYVCVTSSNRFSAMKYLTYAYACSGISIVVYIILFAFSCYATSVSGKVHLITLMLVVILQFGIASVFVA